ncbi:Lipoprotein-anchoring transpeptidase ErfK/SrfK [Nonomuraea maritima]|jgi:lipoprotein-anchoring transpeptidase ErfK/SrfK|uniref:Lipoprotein-anchoring transpeptidase ErfK/SrfK n=1 Tax=Nonomuraea maritima TaxID=683260 RepID=A0A1G8SF21_9ACTN|nr:Lipoprotein-anchoring transpeptidase ErfK/SrfK [Nonomuraea maritima]
MWSGRTVAVTASLLAAALLVTTGCSSPSGEQVPPRAPAKDAPPVAKLAITPVNGTKKVAPDTEVAVKATAGKVTKVTVADAKGRAVEGAVDADGMWRPRWSLRPSTTYTVNASATGTDGKEVTGSATFTTLKPKRVLETGMAPLNGEKVGVGMPVQLLLSKPVASAQDRAAVERSLEVRMSEPVEGAWSWVSDREVQFRPREYWPVGQKVTVIAHLAGVRAGNGLWGDQNRKASFTVGDEHITKISGRTHKAVVRKNGKVVRTIPVSLGKPGDDSWSGTMIAQEKSPSVLMDSATIGRPGLYRTNTKWNVRMTYSGMFFHAAPWSTGSQGHSNVSHGCVNASMGNARWFYNFTQRGDIIQVTGTSRKLKFGNGPTPWVKTWKQWLAGSAVGTSVNG